MSKYSLNPLPNYTPFSGPLLFIIMDGVGLGPKDESDGVHLAYTPTPTGSSRAAVRGS